MMLESVVGDLGYLRIQAMFLSLVLANRFVRSVTAVGLPALKIRRFYRSEMRTGT